MSAAREHYLGIIKDKFGDFVNKDGEFSLLNLVHIPEGLKEPFTLKLPHPSSGKTNRVIALRDFLNHHYQPNDLKSDDFELRDIGSAFMEAYTAAMDADVLNGYAPSNCPTEIIFDLIDMLDEAREARS